MSAEDRSGAYEPSDTMRSRGEESRLKLWVLLEANRWAVAGFVLVGFFLGILLVAAVVPNRVVVTVGDPVETLFQALVTATVTGVTLVVSINSLVLSQELGALGDQRERMEGAMSFRRDVEDELGIDVSPATPATFLRELVDAVGTRGERLSAAAADAEAAGADAERVNEYAAELVRHAAAVGEDLSKAQFGTFDVLSAALDFNYSWKINEGRRLRESLPEDSYDSPGVDVGGDANGDGDSGDDADADAGASARVREELDAVVAVLTLFGPAREHIKTLYFQWELVDLSRAMFYSAVPALFVGTVTILFHGVLTALSATTLGIAHYVWVVALAASIAIAPFAILLSFILRIATVAKRTLAIGPFILRTTEDDAGDGGADE